MQQTKLSRKRAAWRFDPRFLARLQKFVASRPLQTTQTDIIEQAVSEYMDREEERKPGARK